MRRAALLLAAGALLPAACADGDGAAAVDARLAPGALVTPRQEPNLRLRLSGAEDARVRVRLVGRDGTVLAGSRLLRLRGRPQSAPLRLSPSGRHVLGRCGRSRLTLVVREDGGSVRRRGLTTVRDPVRCGPLHWAPPALDEPRTIHLGQGFTQLSLDPGRDYVLRLPATRKLGGTFVEGGRNVVVRGGRVSLPTGTTRDEERRALYFKNQTGTVHVEGVLIDGSGGGEGDAIALSAPAAAVQIENVRVDGLLGSDRGAHADVVQPWGGVRELRIDRLTGVSRFQGLVLPPESAPIGAADIRYANLVAVTPTATALAQPRTGGHMLWLTQPGSCAGYPVGLDRVYVVPRPGRTIATSVWPQVGDGSPCAAVQEGDSVRWPGLAVRGEVRAGAPAGGDFVPRANVGLGYHSPGYRQP